MYMKSGLALYKEKNSSAVDIFHAGVQRNGDDFILRHYLAASLQQMALDRGLDKPGSKILLLEAKKEILKAINIRRESFEHRVLAENFELTGNISEAIGQFSINYFLSQNPADLDWLIRHGDKIPEAADHYFEKGASGIAMMIAYNSLSSFNRGVPPENIVAVTLLEEYFINVSPPEWFSERGEKGGMEVKEILSNSYLKLTEDEKNAVRQTFKQSDIRYLKGIIADGL